MHRYLWIVLLGLLAGCATNTQLIDRRARAAGLERVAFEAAGFTSFIYMNRAAREGSQTLTLWIEGDGDPWLKGIVPNPDPTTANPVALELMLGIEHAGAYITRPCHHATGDAQCTPDKWTVGRYSEDVVDSMLETVQEAGRLAKADRFVLVGYSGGGVLAVLLAERLRQVSAVITLAANLDVAAWIDHHGWLPLSDSLDPAKSIRAHPWPELHFIGAKDSVVPPPSRRAYFERYPAAVSRTVEDYDHSCCWVRDGLPMLAEALRAYF